MSLVFLDFDGVLHPASSTTEPKFCRMPMFEQWLRDRPDVDVVISSSWKEVHPFDEIVGFFAEDLQGRILGCTPLFHRMLDPEAIDPGLQLYKREAEIRRWLQDSGKPSRAWVAIDDMPELFEPGLANLVVCDPDVGLIEFSLAAAEHILLAQRRSANDRARIMAPISSSTPAIFLALDDVLCLCVRYTGNDVKSLFDGEAEYAGASAHDRFSRQDLEALARVHAAMADELFDALFSLQARETLARVHEAMDGGVRYVISSTWKDHFTRDQMASIMMKTGLDFVATNLADDLHWCTPSSFNGARRSAEIEAWLAANPTVDSWIVIDDLDSGASLRPAFIGPRHRLFGRILLCTPGIGLMPEHADQIVSILRPARSVTANESP